jgi:hypothetical protein
MSSDRIDRKASNNAQNWSEIIDAGNKISNCDDVSLPAFVRKNIDKNCLKVIKYGETDSYEIRNQNGIASLVVQKPYYNGGRKTRKNKSFFNKKRKSSRRKTNRRKTNRRKTNRRKGSRR